MNKSKATKRTEGVLLDNYTIAVLEKGICFDKRDNTIREFYKYEKILALYVTQSVGEETVLVIEFMQNGEPWERGYFVKSFPKKQEIV